MDKEAFVISSDKDAAAWVRNALEPLGYGVKLAGKPSAALKAMTGDELVVLCMPDNVATCREIISYCPEATVVAAMADAADCAHALAEGAFQCVQLLCEPVLLAAAVGNAWERRTLRRKLNELEHPADHDFFFGSGAKAQSVVRSLKRDSGARRVLMCGERGAGRAYLAEELHRLRAGNAKLAGELVQVGAAEAIGREGGLAPALAKARAGTLFIRDLEGQKAMDALSEALGAAPKPSEDGKASATRLPAVVVSMNGEHKDDAFVSLFDAVIDVPSLRERQDDILALAERFIQETARHMGTRAKKLSASAKRALKAHNWPGNVSELKGVIRRAMLLAEGGTIEPVHILLEDGTTHCSVKEFLEAKLARFIKGMLKLERSGLHDSVVSEVEKALIEIVSDATGGNQVRTAAVLGITRTTLRKKLAQYGIACGGNGKGNKVGRKAAPRNAKSR